MLFGCQGRTSSSDKTRFSLGLPLSLSSLTWSVHLPACRPACLPVHQVYDATPFLNDHPGGAESILISTGERSAGAGATQGAGTFVRVTFWACSTWFVAGCAGHARLWYHKATAVQLCLTIIAPPAGPCLGKMCVSLCVLSCPEGMDATDEFNSIHSSKAKAMLKDYYIGELVTAEQKAAALTAADKAAAAGAAAAISLTADSSSTNGVANGVNNAAATNGVSSSTELVALDPRKKIPFKLAEKLELSHNVRRFRFALQSPQHKFGLPVGKHVFIYASIGGETVMRAYTPTSQDKDLGHFDLVIKVYR